MAPTPKECDYLVIGGGSGGLASARRASTLYGAKAVVIENKRLGGTCVNVGCVPKKITWEAASIHSTIESAKHYGFSVKETAPFDWTTFVHKRSAHIKKLNGIFEKNLENDKVEYLHGTAKFTAKDTVEVTLDDGSKTSVKGKHVLIACGGRPSKADVPGAELGIDSDGFFELEKQPQRAAIVGAGYIAVEMAGMLNHLGTETHLFIRHDKFLRPFDPLIQDTLMKEYRRQGVHIHANSALSKVEKHPSKEGWLNVTYKDSEGSGTIEVDSLLWAIGRQPETDKLDIDKTGVKLGPKGIIETDDFENTNVSGVYAIGDVVGKVELTPVAIAAGRRLADRLFGGPSKAQARLNYENIPSVIFAHPEAGSIGLTEAQARERHGDANIKVYNTSFTALVYTMFPAEEKGPTAYKLICAGPDEKVVGLHIVGEASAEILQGFGVAVKMGATKADFDSCVAIHPTSAEELVTLK